MSMTMNIKIELSGTPCIRTKMAMADLRKAIKENYGLECEVVKLGVLELDFHIDTQFSNIGIFLESLKDWSFGGNQPIEVKKITTVWKR